MRFEPLEMEGLWLIELDRHVDERGFFARTFCAEEFSAHGLPIIFPQCNLSSSHATASLRGMHINVAGRWESKLVRCVRGAVYDVVVDLRPGSPSEMTWTAVELSADNGRALFVPGGLAHGFLTLQADTDVYYHMGAMYEPRAARGFRWDDPTFSIEWPYRPAAISERDATYPDFEPTTFGLRA